jgi:hypothetical protein
MSKVSKQECKAQVNTAEIDITIYHSEHMIALPIRGEVTVFYRNTMQKKRVSWIAKTFKTNNRFSQKFGSLAFFINESEYPVRMDWHKSPPAHEEDLYVISEKYDLKNPKGVAAFLAKDRSGWFNPVKKELTEVISEYSDILAGINDTGLSTEKILFENNCSRKLIYQLAERNSFGACYKYKMEGDKNAERATPLFDTDNPKLWGRGKLH